MDDSKLIKLLKSHLKEAFGAPASDFRIDLTYHLNFCIQKPTDEWTSVTRTSLVEQDATAVNQALQNFRMPPRPEAYQLIRNPAASNA